MKTLALTALATGTFTSLLFLAPAIADDEPPATGKATLYSLSGEMLGSALFTQQRNGISIDVTAAKLPAGPHAIHIHETGKCEAAQKFETAGEHFNPHGKTHGSMSANPEHGGDMPNVTPDASGLLKMTIANNKIALNSLFDADGSALIIHTSADDYKTQPSGNAGDRIACGVIEK